MHTISNKTYYTTVALILIMAGILRFWGINHSINTDENKTVVPSLKMVQGLQTPLLYPKGSPYPHFYHYILGAAFVPIHFFYPEKTFDSYYNNTFLLTARGISATFSVLTVLITILAGSRLLDRKIGLLSGLFMALIPLNIKYAHYSHVDIPLTFIMTVALYTAIVAWQTKQPKWLVTIGVLVGAATATIYTGLTAGILIPIAHLPYVISHKWKLSAIFRPAFLISLVLIPITFFICSPYSIIKSQESLQTFRAISARGAAGDLGYIRPTFLWPLLNDSQDWGLPFTSASLVKEVNHVLFSLAVIGIGIAIYKQNWSVLLFIAASIVVYYVAISGHIKMSAIKRFMPLTPGIAILAAYAVILVSRLKLPYPVSLTAAAILTLAVIIPSTKQAIMFDQAFAGGSTHKEATQWGYEHVKPGTTVLQHGPLTFFPPDDPNYKVIRLNEVYSNKSKDNPEVAADRAKPIETWIKEEGVQVVVLDSRLVDRYYEETSRLLYPETTASYRQFYDSIRSRGRLLYKISPQLGVIAGPTVEIYDVSDLTRLNH